MSSTWPLTSSSPLFSSATSQFAFSASLVSWMSAQSKWTREEYRRWCHPVKSAQPVNDLTKYYNGEPIGRHGRKKRQADAEDSSDEAEEIAADASVILGPAE